MRGTEGKANLFKEARGGRRETIENFDFEGRVPGRGNRPPVHFDFFELA